MPIASPTPQATAQPPTPLPTLPPPDEVCYATVKQDGLRIRSDSTTTAAILGAHLLNARIRVLEVRYVEGNEWAKNIGVQQLTGWSAAYFQGATYIEYDNSPECLTVRFIEPVLLAFHLIVGTNNTFVALGGNQVGGAKGTSHTQPLLDLLRVVNPRAILIYRSLHNQNGMIDGPLDWEWFNPDVYFAKLWPYLEHQPPFHFVEYINEWPLPKNADGTDNWVQWEKFTIAMLTMFSQHGQCALFGSFGPGAPDIPGWPHIVNVMRWADTHPCGPGRYHGWGTHTTLPMPDWVPVHPDSYIRNPWIVDRDLIFRDWALANTGYDLAQFKGGVFVTEGGWTDYSVPHDRDYSCSEVDAGWEMTEADYRARRPWVRLIALWTLTRDGDPAWFNLQPCLPLLFQ